MDSSIDHYIPRDSDIAFLETPILRYLANCGTVNPHVNRETLARIFVGTAGMVGVSSKEAELYRKLSCFGVASCYNYKTIEHIIETLIQRQKVVYKATGNLGLPANTNNNLSTTNNGGSCSSTVISSSAATASFSVTPLTTTTPGYTATGSTMVSSSSSAYQALRGNIGISHSTYNNNVSTLSSPYNNTISSSSLSSSFVPPPNTMTTTNTVSRTPMNNNTVPMGPRRAQDGSIVSMNYRALPPSSIPLSVITNTFSAGSSSSFSSVSQPLALSSSSVQSSSLVQNINHNHSMHKISSTLSQPSSYPLSSSSISSGSTNTGGRPVLSTSFPSNNSSSSFSKQFEQNNHQHSSSSSSSHIPSITSVSTESMATTLSKLASEDTISSSSVSSSSSGSSSSSSSVGDELSSLTEEQLRIYKLAMDNHSIFFTGSAGTGKSFLLRLIIKGLKAKFVAQGRPDAVIVTAPTGIAACNIGGVTIHSFAGIGRGNGNIEEIVKDIRNRNYTCRRWRSCHVLIIDEVSMLDGELFDKLEYVSRKVRQTEAPFGGLQLIIAGDFFQLPPVGLDQTPDSQRQQYSSGSSSSFNRGGGRGRGGYQRGGHSSYPNSQHSSSYGASTDNSKPVKFCFEASCWNQVLYAQLSLRKVFRQSDTSMISMLNEMRLGRVSDNTVSLLSRAGYTLQRIEREHPELKPTKLFAVNSWVDKVNDEELRKCPGQSMAYNAVDTGDDTFVPQLESLPVPKDLTLKIGAQVILLKNIDPEAGLVNGARGVIVDFRENPESENPKYLPFVEFTKVGDTIPVSRLIAPAEWTIELGNRPVATRSQLPLKCAWALSIHKSQGMTIDLLEICLSRVFEFGQAYVALSRAVSLDRLRVTGFQPNVVKAHPRVLEFYHRLMTNSSQGIPTTTGGNTGGALPRPTNAVSLKPAVNIPPPAVPFSNVSLPLTIATRNENTASVLSIASTTVNAHPLSNPAPHTGRMEHLNHTATSKPNPPVSLSTNVAATVTPSLPPTNKVSGKQHILASSLWSGMDDDLPDTDNDNDVIEIIEYEQNNGNDDTNKEENSIMPSNENYQTGKRIHSLVDADSIHQQQYQHHVNRPFKQPRRTDEDQ